MVLHMGIYDFQSNDSNSFNAQDTQLKSFFDKLRLDFINYLAEID